MSAPHRQGRDGGFVTTELVVAAGFGLVLLTLLANLVVDQYGKGVLHAAVDEAVRVGSRAEATVADCAQRGAAVLDALLGGRMGDGATLRCTEEDGTVTAEARAVLRGWLPLVPDWPVVARGTAVAEALP